MSSKRPKIIYVMGGHHIGSTVLGVTLGNCQGCFFAGEVHSWFTKHGLPAYRHEAALRFWEEVSANVQNGAELFGDDTELYLDRSSALRLSRLRRWPTTRRELRPPYRRATEELYRAIANAAGAENIIDSSHYPLRARELQSLDGIDLYLVFLVRDPQGVVASHDPRSAAGSAKSALITNLHLWATHVLSLLVFLRQPPERRLFLRHEQFLADPENVIRQILDGVESDAALPDLTALHTGSPLQGNPLLKEERVLALRGPPGPPPRPSRMTTLLQAPWTPVFSLLHPAISNGSGAPAPEERLASSARRA
ncbi:MAG TPA: hypothetical protein VMB51_14650 [Solirubrobacteraceae bacterium]|nr:hypothetical protein [Solirubrobacteraceae bacterium]